MAKYGHCPYCERTMTAPGHENGPRSITKDHYTPKASGGRETIGCCLECNNDKKNMPIDAWLNSLQSNGDFRARIVERFISSPRAEMLEPLGIEPDACVRTIAPVVAHSLWGKSDAGHLSAAHRRQARNISLAIVKALRKADLLK